jgi:hypothetical protein
MLKDPLLLRERFVGYRRLLTEFGADTAEIAQVISMIDAVLRLIDECIAVIKSMHSFWRRERDAATELPQRPVVPVLPAAPQWLCTPRMGRAPPDDRPRPDVPPEAAA